MTQALSLIHPDDDRAFRGQIQALNEVGKSQSFEFRARRRDGSEIWLRDDITVIRLDGIAEPVQLSCFSDITDRKDTEWRLRFLHELAEEMTSEGDCERAFSRMLHGFLRFYGADRYYVAELPKTGNRMCVTYEACAAGGENAGERPMLPLDKAEPWYRELSLRKCFYLSGSDAVWENCRTLRETLRGEETRSLLLAPIFAAGRLIAFAGIENATSLPRQPELWTAPADDLAILLTRGGLPGTEQSLPGLCVCDGQSLPGHRETAAVTGRKTVLVIDDSSLERAILTGFLQPEYETETADSGEAALTLLAARHEQIAAILLDIVMPGMDGYEVLRRLESVPALACIPVVVSTGLEDDAAREKAIRCGANAFVTKPYNRTLLLHAVRNAVHLRELTTASERRPGAACPAASLQKNNSDRAGYGDGFLRRLFLCEGSGGALCLLQPCRSGNERADVRAGDHRKNGCGVVWQGAGGALFGK